jgi:hypothetical protein
MHPNRLFKTPRLRAYPGGSEIEFRGEFCGGTQSVVRATAALLPVSFNATPARASAVMERFQGLFGFTDLSGASESR